MLGKLIKHELRATGRIMLPVAAAILALSVLAGISTVLLDSPRSPGLVNTLAVIILVLFFLGLFGIFVVAVVLMIERFYRNLLRDEGYIMFTLPTTPDALIWSKLIVSFIWFAVTAVLCVLGMLLMLVISNSAVDWSFTGNFGEIFDKALYVIGEGRRLAGAGHIILWVLELIAVLFAASCALCLRFYSAMSIGQSFDSHKVLMSVVFYFVIAIAIDTLSINGLNSGLFNTFQVTFNEFSPGLVHAVLLSMLAAELVLAALYYLITTLFLRRKLNLA